MAYNVTSLIVFAVCHGQHARAASNVTRIGKAMPKAFVPTGHMPRRWGSMLVNRADAVAQAKSGAAPTFRFPVHEAPSSNQFDSALRMQGAPMNKQSEGHKEVVQHLRARVQSMPQVDDKDAQYRFAFGILMFLMASVGLVASIGTAVVQQYLARVQQTLESTIPGSVASDTNNRTKQKMRVWIWQTQHDRCPKAWLSAKSEKTLDPRIKLASEEYCVSISNPKAGQSVTLIGVWHGSLTSVQKVKRLIEELQPEAVMIELDPERVGGEIRVARVTDSEDIDVPISASPAMDKELVGILRKAIVENLNREHARFRREEEKAKRARDFAEKKRRIGEFEQAIRSAEDCTVCDTVILGDCSIETIFGRLAEVAIENNFWLCERILEREVLKETIVRKRRGDQVEFETAMLETLKQDSHVIKLSTQAYDHVYSECRNSAYHQAVIKERDYLMSESIRRELERRPEEVKTLVGVVGANHVLGMERHLKAVFADEPAPL